MNQYGLKPCCSCEAEVETCLADKECPRCGSVRCDECAEADFRCAEKT